MNEVLIINKNKNMTSRDVVNFLCKKFNTKKIGHTGTLDPLATGVMVILIGKYTKLVELITSYDKVYEADVLLGLLTDTLDITGNVLKEEEVNYKDAEIKETLKNMVGEYIQTVPIYSAIKVNGKKLYEYARNNEKIKLPKRNVNIKELELISDIKKCDKFISFKIRAHVSKGTYIRALINDIAKNLNTVGTMTSLKRIKQGNISIDDSFTLEDIKNDKFKFYDIKKCLDIFTVEVNEDLYTKLKNGMKIKNIYNQELVLFKYKNQEIAIYKNEDNYLKCWKYLL